MHDARRRRRHRTEICRIVRKRFKRRARHFINNRPHEFVGRRRRRFQIRKRICYACGIELADDRVRDHCHLTGKYRGAAHSNLRMKTPKFVPFLFHNFEGYDSHLFIKSLGLSKGKINCIPKTDEKYISFSKSVVMDNEGGVT